MKKQVRDLTEGSPIKAIIAFGVPVLLGNLIQQLYSLTDTAIVGQFIGIDALAGVGSTSSLNFLVMGFVQGTCTGFSVPMAQSYGSHDLVRLRKLFVNSIYLAIVISIFLTIVTLTFIDEILLLMNSSDAMMSYSKTYISTIFAGIIGMYLYNLMASALRSVGNSRTPLFFLIASAIANVILDLFFVLVLKIGVLGTALATVLSQTVAGIICLIYIYKEFEVLRIKANERKIEKDLMRKLLGNGIPMGLQFSITAIGSVILQSAVNTLGSVYVAAITAGSRISSFTLKGLETIGISMAMYTGQNIGAKKYERINKGLIQSLLLGMAYSVACFIIVFFAGKYLALIFVSANETEAIECILQFLIVNSASYFLNALLHIFRNTIQGAGYASIAMYAGVFELVARCFVAFYLVGNFGFSGAVWANPVAWAAAILFLVPAYFFVMKMVRKKIEKI